MDFPRNNSAHPRKTNAGGAVISRADKSRAGCRFLQRASWPVPRFHLAHKKPSHRREVTFGVAYYTHIILTGLAGSRRSLRPLSPLPFAKSTILYLLSSKHHGPFPLSLCLTRPLSPGSKNLFLPRWRRVPTFGLATEEERIRVGRPRCRN